MQSPDLFPPILFVLRVKRLSAETLQLFQRLAEETRCDVCIAINDPQAEFSRAGNCFIVPVHEDSVRGAGLLYMSEVFWRCGDYALLLAFLACGSYDFYYMMEADVFLNTTDLAKFFRVLQADDKTDFLAADVTPAGPWWFWHNTMAPFSTDVRRCLFPFVRLTRIAVEFLLSVRRHLSNLFASRLDLDGNVRGYHDWPNDEAFCATMLVWGGLSIADLNATGQTLWSPGTFSFSTPISRVRLEMGAPDEMIYHPVLKGADFLAKSRGILASLLAQPNPEGLARQIFVGNAFATDLAIECGPETTQSFLRELEAIGIVSWTA